MVIRTINTTEMKRPLSLKASEFGTFLANLPPLDEDDKIDFQKEVKAIRTQMTFEENPWD